MDQPLIGLMTNENPSLLVGMLGILKAGAAFVPIRSDYPDSRVDWMIEDCAIRILVTERAHQARAEAIAARNPALQHVVYLDELPPAPAQLSPDPDPVTSGVSFSVDATTSWGQNIYVTGNRPELGAWNPGSALKLDPAAYPVWKLDVELPEGTSFEYKYIRKDESGNVTWESGANRTATVTSTRTTLNDTWRD